MENEYLWKNVPMTARIATYVSYSGVFGDVASISEMTRKMAITSMDEFNNSLDELVAGKYISVKDGFAALPCLEAKISLKAANQRKAELLIKSKLKFLKRLSWLPLIKFIGISGSLAAGNPVFDKDNKIDIDVFVITRNQFLWFFLIPLRISRRIIGINANQCLCFNFIMDESDLRIYNRNFYTANEMWNLIPVSGLKTYKKFISVNNWVNIYFPGFTKEEDAPAFRNSANILNKIMYLVFIMFRCLRKISLKPVKDISFRHKPYNEVNVNRVGQHYGGYQAMVLKRFINIKDKWFPNMISDEIIQLMFPDYLSELLRKENYDIEEFNRKTGYKPLNHAKYEEQ